MSDGKVKTYGGKLLISPSAKVATADACCCECVCDHELLASTYAVSFHYEGRDAGTNALVCEGDVTGLVLGEVLIGEFGDCRFDCEDGVGADECPVLGDCGLLANISIHFNYPSICRWQFAIALSGPSSGGTGPSTSDDPTGAYTDYTDTFGTTNYTFSNIVVS